MKKEDKNQQQQDRLMMSNIFWKNFLTVIGIFLGVTLMFAYMPGEDGERAMGLSIAYFFTSAFCVLLLGVKIGQEYSRYEDVDQKMNKFLKQEGMSIQDFRKKYRDVIAIYRDSEYLDFGDVQNSVSNVLADKQIINFLKCIKNDIDISGSDEERDIYEMLDKNISLKEIFKKSEEGYGYSLDMIEMGESGHILVVLEGTEPMEARGGLWRLTLSSGGSIKKCVLEEHWMS